MEEQEQQRYHRQQYQKKNCGVVPEHGLLNLEEMPPNLLCSRALQHSARH
jgi:hypothetical protein